MTDSTQRSKKTYIAPMTSLNEAHVKKTQNTAHPLLLHLRTGDHLKGAIIGPVSAEAATTDDHKEPLDVFIHFGGIRRIQHLYRDPEFLFPVLLRIYQMEPLDGRLGLARTG